MIPAIQGGIVDAINIWRPPQYEAERKLGATIKAFPHKVTNNYLLLTTTGAATKKRELLRRTTAVAASPTRERPRDRDACM